MINNCLDDTPPFSHEKLKMIELSHFYGLTYENVFCHFDKTSINIFVQDIITFDSTLTYTNSLAKNQIGLLASRTFESTIPQEMDQFKNFSTESTLLNSVFNGFVIRGIPNAPCNFFAHMTGSLNMLIMELSEKYQIVNLSKIVLSYLVECHPDITEEDTYMTDEFPIVHSSPQLYFFEDLILTVPDVDEFLKINETLAKRVSPEPVTETEDILPLTDQLLISELKDKIVSSFYVKQKTEYESKQKKLDENYKSECLNLGVKVKAWFEEQKAQLSEELKRLENEEKEKQDEMLRELDYEKSAELESQLKEKKESLFSELNAKRIAEHKKIDVEIQARLETELKRVKKISDDMSSSAYLASQQEIQIFTTKAYSNLSAEIDTIRQQKLKEIHAESAKLHEEEMHRINAEHIKEKERLENLLVQYEKAKKQETEAKFSKEYLEEFSKAMTQVHGEMEVIKMQKMTELHNKLALQKEQMISDMSNIERAMKHQTEIKLNRYRDDSMKSYDAYIERLKAERTATEELKLSNEINAFRITKTKELEEKIMEDLTKEVSTLREVLLKNTSKELEEYKVSELQRAKINQEKQLEVIFDEKVAEQRVLLELREAKLKAIQDEKIEAKYSEQLVELQSNLRVKKYGIELEIQEFKNAQVLEVKKFIEEMKENEKLKLDTIKMIQQETIKQEHDRQKKKTAEECEQIKQIKLDEIEKELIGEKEKLNAALEETFKSKLEEKHVAIEDEVKLALAKKLTEIEKQNESLVNKLLKKLKASQQIAEDEIKRESVELEKTVIEIHNKRIRELEEDYSAKTALHKTLMKSTVSEERESLILQFKLKFDEEMQVMREKELAKQLQEIEREVHFAKSLKLEQIDEQILEVKKEKMKAIDGDLELYRRESEKKITEQYRKLYDSLK